MAVFLVGSMLQTGADRNRTWVLRSLILITIVPGSIASAGWRERRPAFGYESLFLATRETFVYSIALAMTFDLARIYGVVLPAALLPIAIWDPRLLLSGSTAASVTASLLMQVLFLGATLVLARFGSWPVWLGVMCACALATARPIVRVWPPHASLSAAQLLAVALGEMLLGVALGLAGFASWNRAEFD